MVISDYFVTIVTGKTGSDQLILPQQKTTL